MKTSRQYRWQQKKIAEGNCSRCGARRNHYAVFCDGCQLNHRLTQQKRSGARAWRMGGRGRPPKVMAPAPRRARR